MSINVLRQLAPVIVIESAYEKGRRELPLRTFSRPFKDEKAAEGPLLWRDPMKTPAETSSTNPRVPPSESGNYFQVVAESLWQSKTLQMLIPRFTAQNHGLLGATPSVVEI